MFFIDEGSRAADSTAPIARLGRRHAQASTQQWNKLDPTVGGFVRRDTAKPFFPEIGKDGFIFAGGGGHGIVYEQGQHVGYAELVEGSS